MAKLIPHLVITAAVVLLLVQSSYEKTVSSSDKHDGDAEDPKSTETQTFEIPSSNYEYPDDNYYFESGQTDNKPAKQGEKGHKKPLEKVGLHKDEVKSNDPEAEDENADDDGAPVEDAPVADSGDDKQLIPADESHDETPDDSVASGEKSKSDSKDQSSLSESSLEKSKSNEGGESNKQDTTNPPKKPFMDRRILIALCSAAGAIVLVIIAIVGFKYYRYHKYKSVKQGENPS